jgi:hypothetical protein
MTGPLTLRFRHLWNGEVIETDVAIMPRSKWLADPRACDDSWSVCSVDDGGTPLTVAVQLTLSMYVVDVSRAIPASQ